MIKNPLDTALEKHLDYLKLPYLKENCRPFAAEGNTKHWSHIDYLARLIEGEAAARHDRTILHRIKAARFPVIKTLESFRWDWPKKINQLQIQDLFRLRFIDEKANHPDRPSSKYYYEIYIEEDLLERARRERI
jgi:DNA replication protein DnaC